MPKVTVAENHRVRVGDTLVDVGATIDVTAEEAERLVRVDAAYTGSAPEPEADDEAYDNLLKDDLLAEAESRGLEVPSGATKADVAGLLEADDAED